MNRTYNPLNRLIETLGGEGQSTTFGYDANGNQTAITVDPLGLNQATLQAFDALNRLSTTTDADNGITSYTYDARDNLTSVTDAEGLTTMYSYDAFDRLIEQDSPDTGITSFGYDETGNRIRQTDARGVTTLYSYDALNRLTLIDYPDNTQDVTYTYDSCTNGIGRLCQMSDESGSTDYVYDARGNLTTQTTIRDGALHTTSYAYNGVDQLIQMTYPSGRTIDYSRNTLGQVDNVTTTFNSVTETVGSTLTYQPFGPMNGMIYGNNLTQTRSYDLDYRLTQLFTMNGVMHQDLQYNYNDANNITDITNNLDSNRSQLLDYDMLNRLSDATGNYGDIDYAYDAIGNRLSESIDTQTETYTYDINSHQLLQTQGSNITDYTYDAMGNTISNTEFDFSYGDNNRLKEVSILGSAVATYTYNGRGERTKKDTNGTIVYYHYDQAGQLIAETDELGNTLNEYVYIDGQPLALISDNNIHYYLNDHLGTPQQLTDQNQNIVWQADYSPFGEANITTELVTNNLRFAGQYFDQETGLHYNYFRYYDPQLGRYITSDPIGLLRDYSDPQLEVAIIYGALEETGFANEQLNHLYGYVGQNPLSFFDPYGLAKGGKQNIRDSGLDGLSDSEVSARARDPNISKEERRKAQKEEKARKQRNKVKRGKKSNLGKIKGIGPATVGPLLCEIIGPNQFNPFCLPEPPPDCGI